MTFAGIFSLVPTGILDLLLAQAGFVLHVSRDSCDFWGHSRIFDGIYGSWKLIIAIAEQHSFSSSTQSFR